MDYEQQAYVEANELTDSQVQAFLSNLEYLPAARAPIHGKGLRLLFEFMEDTGSRVTEALHTRKQDLNFETRIWVVTHPKSESQCPCSRWKYRDLYSRSRILDYADPQCDKCHGKGKYKKPQKTTFTPRLWHKLQDYTKNLKNEDLLWPVSRVSVWRWGKKAGEKAGIRIFQEKENITIKGIFPHLFRALCSKRMAAIAKDDKYKDALVACKMRHSYKVVTDRYTKITIGYLFTFESKIYSDAL